MDKFLIINDLHLGVQRTGGTTLASASALRKWAHEQHRKLLQTAAQRGAKKVIVNGDLTDTYDIGLTEGLEVLAAAKEFMDENPDIGIVWVLGNHDLSKDSSRLGIVAFLGSILEALYPRQFTLVRAPMSLGDGVHVIPHVPNQDLFELALGQVPEGTQYLLLHCNYDNTFAGQQDHSLNLSREQARKFRDRGIRIVLGHEHQGRTLMGGNLVIVGNQFPTSVADCLSHGDAQKDGKKYALLIGDAGPEPVQTWAPDDADGWYAEVDWQELRDVTEDGRGFVRVSGGATAAQAAEVIKEISAFRQRAQSFVVTNAVRVEGNDAVDEALTTQEDIRQIDVIGLLLEMLEPAQAAKVRELTGHSAPQETTT